MVQTVSRFQLMSLALSIVGCGVGPSATSESAEVHVSEAAISDDNGLDFNGVGPNGLDSNGLDHNGLDHNGLDHNGLDHNGALATWYAGNPTLNAKVMKYLAKCALPAGQSLDYGGVTYPGAIGLAPGWQHAPATAADRAWVSACLLAHVNAKAQSVLVSFRSPNAPGQVLGYTAAEAGSYLVPEATFWGNLFSGATISKRVCAEGRISQTAASDYEFGNASTGRNCGSATSSCGMTLVASVLSGGKYTCYQSVAAPTAPCSAALSTSGANSCQGVSEVITTFIPGWCGDGMCSGAETPVSCSKDCGTKTGGKLL